MSKQSDAKKEQGYDPKPVPRICSTCEFYKSVIVESKSIYGLNYSEESEKRCGLGGFAVKKTATCNKYQSLWTPV